MSKFELVNMFGNLELFGIPSQKNIDEDYACFQGLDQRFTWNGIGCSIDIEREDYPELTPDLVRELCASFILEKIGKSIEG